MHSPRLYEVRHIVLFFNPLAAARALCAIVYIISAIPKTQNIHEEKHCCCGKCKLTRTISDVRVLRNARGNHVMNICMYIVVMGYCLDYPPAIYEVHFARTHLHTHIYMANTVVNAKVVSIILLISKCIPPRGRSYI